DPGSNIHLLNAIDAAQLLRADLAWRGFLTGTRGGKGEHASSSNSENPADDALLSHAHADHRMAVAFAGQELDPCDVVRQRGGRAHNFVEVGGVGQHLFERLIELLGRPKIMKRKNQTGP